MVSVMLCVSLSILAVVHVLIADSMSGEGDTTDQSYPVSASFDVSAVQQNQVASEGENDEEETSTDEGANEDASDSEGDNLTNDGGGGVDNDADDAAADDDEADDGGGGDQGN